MSIPWWEWLARVEAVGLMLVIDSVLCWMGFLGDLLRVMGSELSLLTARNIIWVWLAAFSQRLSLWVTFYHQTKYPGSSIFSKA